tara:strand:- start:1506 stop:1649 length:144 start_codon:yes stop_codon:yes gene_type:complete
MGLEPITLRLEVSRAIQLRHADRLQRPGIEPGATAWKADMLPLHHRC